MDFIKANSPQPVQPSAPVAKIEGQAVVPTGTPIADPVTPDTQVLIDKMLATHTAEIIKEKPDATPQSTPKAELPKTEPTRTEPPIDSDAPTFSPARASFKKLETALKAKDSVIRERETALEAANKIIEDYKTGTATPQALQEAQNKIADLTRFKHLVDFKGSPEYESQVLKPLTDIDARLTAIAADYEIPVEALQDAMKSSRESDINRFLSDHFDAIGGTEVKQLLNQKKALEQQSKDAEKAPEQAFAIMRENHRRAMEVRDAERKSNIAASAMSSWQDALGEIVSKGEVKELILQDGNTEFNEKVSRPLLNAASTEYGKAISELAAEGVTKLRPEFAKALATTFLLAQASAYSLRSRDLAIKEVNDLQRSGSQMRTILRPNIGSSAPQSAPAPTAGPMETPLEAGKSLIQTILSKKRA